MATENRKPAAAGGRESAGRRAGLPAGTRSSALRNPTVGQSPLGLQVARAGSFRSLEHATTGRAIVLRRPAGHLILWLERLSTSNGPDLRVYLCRVPASSDLHTYRTGFIDLGALKGNRAARTMPSRPAPTFRHSTARSSGAADLQLDSA